MVIVVPNVADPSTDDTNVEILLANNGPNVEIDVLSNIPVVVDISDTFNVPVCNVFVSILPLFIISPVFVISPVF